MPVATISKERVGEIVTNRNGEDENIQLSPEGLEWYGEAVLDYVQMKLGLTYGEVKPLEEVAIDFADNGYAYTAG